MIKHSGAATASVDLRLTDETVDVDITDPGPARSTRNTTGSGHGLIGLAERAALVGGSVTSGAQGEGFRVHAVLPAQGARR